METVLVIFSSLCNKIFMLLLKSSFYVVVIATVQLHSTKSELRLCAGSSHAQSMLEICSSENL